MRWIWIDKFTEFSSGVSATAIKNVSLAEDYLHDQYPCFPVMPNSLIIEGMAQTAGLLVGEASQFAEKVVLAKIGRARFSRLVRPGDTLVFKALIEQMNEQGASVSGRVSVAGPPSEEVAQIELMLSHIDQNMAGTIFPKHNFVFSEQFTGLVKSLGADMSIRL